MSRSRALITAALCTAMAACVIVPSFIRAGDAASTAPSTSPANADGRTINDIDADLNTANGQFRDAVPSVKMIGDAAFRKDNAGTVVPLLKKMSHLLGEVATVNPDAADEATRAQISTLGMAVGFGDNDAAKTLENLSRDPGWLVRQFPSEKEKTAAARCALTMGRWINASANPNAQEKVLADFIEIAKADPKEDQFADTLKIMAHLGAANPDLSKKALAVITNTLTGEAAQQLAMQFAAVDKPIILAGRTTTGARFTSAKMKGKVILVDFWATWCVPCQELMPEVKKLYADYHAQGLEIIGVDCDADDAVVNDFTKENAMPWLQLRESSQNDDENWSPIAKKFGVERLPTMFIIDKKGILRYIDDEEPNEKIKQLLAEPDPAAAKPAPAPKPK